MDDDDLAMLLVLACAIALVAAWLASLQRWGRHTVVEPGIVLVALRRENDLEREQCCQYEVDHEQRHASWCTPVR